VSPGSANGNGNGRRRAVFQRPTRKPSAHAVLNRFARILGKRFSTKNLDLLAEAHLACSGLQRNHAAIRGRGANIFTQWVGDPDALGSAIILKTILEHLGATKVRILTAMLGHPQNRNLIERCGIEIHDPNDHHTSAEVVEENCRSNSVRQVRLPFVGLPVGSTSAFLAAVGFGFGIFDKLDAASRAAVALGIYTDTSALLHGATPLDFRMFEKLTRDAETQGILDELRDYRVPVEWYEYRIAGFTNLESTGAVKVAPVGYVREDHRDVVAELSNDLLRIEGTAIGIAIAVTQKGTEVSVRADSRLLGGDPARIVTVVDHLLGYAFPGVSGFKYERRPPHRVEGGAHVPHGQAEERMWKLGTGGDGDEDVSLAHCRACARAVIAALQDLSLVRPEETKGLL
jgi:nanoRNase/pAp phosphatase (c-di-AMP/oligoRNAs hydrolase)